MCFSMINGTHVPLPRPLPLNTCSSLMPDWYALSFRTPSSLGFLSLVADAQLVG
jgi:hypothetical protein